MSSVILFCHLLFSPLHIGHLAEYQYILKGNKFSLKFIIEKEELFNFKTDDDCNYRLMTALCISRYLDKHTLVKINDERIRFELESSNTQSDYLIVNLKASKKVIAVNRLQIQNTCFLEFDEKFKNRVVINIHNTQKSYLLTEEKQNIDLNLGD